MNKKLILLGILLTMSLLLVNSASALQVTTVNNPVAGVNPGITASGSFTVTDEADADATIVTAISFVSADLISGSNSITNTAISFNPSSIANLADDSTSSPVVVNVAIPANQADGTYSGLVTVNGSEGGPVSATYTLSVTVSPLTAANVQTYDNSTPLEIIGEEGQTGITGTFTLQNTGNQVLNALTFDTTATGFDLSDSDNNAITLSFSNPGSLNPGQSATVTVTASFASGLDLDTYGGTVNVRLGGITGVILDSFKLDLKVHPEICTDGIVNDGNPASSSTADLDINVREPDSGDEFKAGDTIKIDVRVDNNGDADLDVAVHAILYDLDQDDEIADFETSAEEIKDGNEETFEFDLDVPSSSDLDEDNRYVLFVKAFEDGDEDQNCNFDSINLDFEREREEVVFNTIDMTPNIAKPGDIVNLRLDIQNEGTRDQDNI